MRFIWITHAPWKVSKYGVICGPTTGKYGPEITPYLDTFHAGSVNDFVFAIIFYSEILEAP